MSKDNCVLLIMVLMKRYFALNKQKFYALIMKDKALISIIIKHLKGGFVLNTYYSVSKWVWQWWTEVKEVAGSPI